MLGFAPLSVPDRLRLAAGVGYLRLLPSPGSLEDQTAGRWMRRVMGSPAYDTVWAPLLNGKFGDAAEEVSMAWLWARIHCRTASLGYIHGRFSWSFAAPFAQPIVTPTFARTIPGFDTPVSGLYVANMFQVYPYDRGQNYSIDLAERLVRHLEA